MIDFIEGYKQTTDQLSGGAGVYIAKDYIEDIDTAIKKMADDINKFDGYGTDVSRLKGDIAEFYHADTFNINAALNDSKYKVSVDRSHDFASPDISTNFGDVYGLKYYKNAAASANAQSKSLFEYYMEHCKGKCTFEEFLSKEGIDRDKVLMHDPMYCGQLRIIPSDQYNEALAFLRKIIKIEKVKRPELARKYQETLNLLRDTIQAPDGTKSMALTEEQSKILARLAKEGCFDPQKYGISIEELMEYKYILHEGLKAGASAAIISFILKTAPYIHKILNDLIKKGYIDEDSYKNMGTAALSGGAEGFLKGSIAASLTIAARSGMLGEAFQNLNPSVIGALTVVCLNTIQDSILLARGKISKDEFVDNAIKATIVSACSVGLGILLASQLNAIGYMLGSFVGSILGSFVYNAANATIISYCVHSGFTFFGIVDQNYSVPNEILEEIGFDVMEPEYIKPDYMELDYIEPDYIEPDYMEITGLDMKILRRGVIGIRRIGYTIN